MDFFPETFNDAPLGSSKQVNCSPQAPSSEWSGVIIAAPQQVILQSGETPVVPVCGHYLVPVLDAKDGPPQTFHVTRVETMEILTARIVEEVPNEPVKPRPADAPPPHSRESLKGVYTGGYFNVDAQRYLSKPLEPGRYEVVVSYAGFVSNRVAISIETAPEEDDSTDDK